MSHEKWGGPPPSAETAGLGAGRHTWASAPGEVFLSLGSNLGDREQNLRDALALLESPQLHLTRRSSLYETDPVDLTDQPAFLNLAAAAETTFAPEALLAHTQRVERELGRTRTIPKGPRTIDIDILLYGREVIETPELSIPHPRMHRRRFVLEPLAELAPELRHPATHRTIAEMLADTLHQGVRKVGGAA